MTETSLPILVFGVYVKHGHGLETTLVHNQHMFTSYKKKKRLSYSDKGLRWLNNGGWK